MLEQGNKKCYNATSFFIFLDSFPQHSVYPGHCESSNDAVIKNHDSLTTLGGLQISMLSSVNKKKGTEIDGKLSYTNTGIAFHDWRQLIATEI